MNLSGQIFVDLQVGFDYRQALDRVGNVFERRTADNTIAQRFDFLATFNDCAGRDATQGTAILFTDDHVLRNVDEPARQITRVSCFQCCVGKTFSRTVRRDNFTRGTGHQTAHTRQLTNLLGATARAGITHYQDRIEFAGRTFAIIHRLKHFFRHFVCDFRPDGDHLVVAFAVCDHAIEVLLFDSDHIFVGLVDQRLLRRWRYQVVDADGDAGFGRIQEAEVLQIVKHLDGHFMAQTNMRVVDQRLQPLLLQGAVDERKSGWN